MKIFNKKIHLTKKACTIIAISLSIITICFIYLKKNHYIFSEFSYTIDKENKEVTITGYRNEDTHIDTLVIPREICNLPVTTIGEQAFSSTYMLKLVLPDTINTLGKQCFYYCTCLNEVVGLNYVENIEYGVFGYCISLKKITLLDNSREDFQNNDEYILDSVNIPETVTSLESCVFYENHSIKHATISCNLDTLPRCTFCDCKLLETINIIGTVKVIDRVALCYNPNLTTVTISEGTKKIDCFAFSSCPALQTIYLPASLEYIDPEAFTKHSDFLTIIAPSGSYAEQYAHDNSILFKASDSLE